MGICYNSIFLTFFMYLKYIVIFTFVVLFIYSFFNKNNIYANRIKKVLLIIIIIIYSLMVIFNLLNLKAKNCFNYSNPNKLYYVSKLYNSYTSDGVFYSYDSSNIKIKPTEEKELKDRDYNLKIFNINYFPLSNVKFNFDSSNTSYSMKDSGVEIATLATAISSLNYYNNDITPIDIINSIRFNEIAEKNLDIDNLLYILHDEYDFNYSEIASEQIDDALDRDGLVLIKLHGASEDTIFTCSDSYILVYAVDKGGKYYVVNVNDKDYDTICDINSVGFGNFVKANQNKNYFYYTDIVDNAERFFVLWR